jgi:hypothetical protein
VYSSAICYERWVGFTPRTTTPLQPIRADGERYGEVQRDAPSPTSECAIWGEDFDGDPWNRTATHGGIGKRRWDDGALQRRPMGARQLTPSSDGVSASTIFRALTATHGENGDPWQNGNVRRSNCNVRCSNCNVRRETGTCGSEA